MSEEYVGCGQGREGMVGWGRPRENQTKEEILPHIAHERYTVVL